MSKDTSTVDWEELRERLSEPFPPHAVSWRAGATSQDRKRAQALAYAEPRVYEDRLNEVCPGAWSVVFKPWGETRIICELTIHGVTRASTGEFDSSDRVAQGTAAEAQAFKRACSKFGLGRYLYDIPLVWVDYDDTKKRLLDTPELKGRFAPQPDRPAPAARAARREAASPAPAEGAAEAGSPKPTAARASDQRRATDEGTPLGADRAEAMRRELEKLGIARRDHLKFAATVLGRSVRNLTTLTDQEAVEVWNVARRSHQDLAV